MAQTPIEYNNLHTRLTNFGNDIQADSLRRNVKHFALVGSPLVNDEKLVLKLSNEEYLDTMSFDSIRDYIFMIDDIKASFYDKENMIKFLFNIPTNVDLGNYCYAFLLLQKDSNENYNIVGYIPAPTVFNKVEGIGGEFTIRISFSQSFNNYSTNGGIEVFDPAYYPTIKTMKELITNHSHDNRYLLKKGTSENSNKLGGLTPNAFALKNHTHPTPELTFHTHEYIYDTETIIPSSSLYSGINSFFALNNEEFPFINAIGTYGKYNDYLFQFVFDPDKNRLFYRTKKKNNEWSNLEYVGKYDDYFNFSSEIVLPKALLCDYTITDERSLISVLFLKNFTNFNSSLITYNSSENNTILGLYFKIKDENKSAQIIWDNTRNEWKFGTTSKPIFYSEKGHIHSVNEIVDIENFFNFSINNINSDNIQEGVVNSYYSDSKVLNLIKADIDSPIKIGLDGVISIEKATEVSDGYITKELFASINSLITNTKSYISEDDNISFSGIIKLLDYTKEFEQDELITRYYFDSLFVGHAHNDDAIQSINWEKVVNRPEYVKEFGITDVYTDEEIDILLSQKAPTDNPIFLGDTRIQNLIPLSDNAFNIGTGLSKFKNIYAENFIGKASSSVIADKLSTPISITIDGNLSGNGVLDDTNSVELLVSNNLINQPAFFINTTYNIDTKTDDLGFIINAPTNYKIANLNFNINDDYKKVSVFYNSYNKVKIITYSSNTLVEVCFELVNL
jgi:hypothetical protein